MAQISVGDNGGIWTAIPRQPGHSVLIIQLRAEADSFAANTLEVRNIGEPFSDGGIILEDGESIALPGGGAYEVKPQNDVQLIIRYLYLP